MSDDPTIEANAAQLAEYLEAAKAVVGAMREQLKFNVTQETRANIGNAAQHVGKAALYAQRLANSYPGG